MTKKQREKLFIAKITDAYKKSLTERESLKQTLNYEVEQQKVYFDGLHYASGGIQNIKFSKILHPDEFPEAQALYLFHPKIAKWFERYPKIAYLLVRIKYLFIFKSFS